MDPHDEFARDRNGRIITDRFGRPVRRRPVASPTERPTEPPVSHSAGRPAERPTKRPEGWPAARSTAGRSPAQPADRSSSTPRRHHKVAPEPPKYRQAPQPQQQQSPHHPPQQQYAPPQPHYVPPQAQHNRPPNPAVIGGRSNFARPHQAQSHHTPHRSRGRQRRGGVGIKKILGLMVLTVLVVTLGTAIWIDTNLQRTDALASYQGQPKSSMGATNWLLVGSDSRAGLNAADGDRLMAGNLGDTGNRTDTIMLVHVPMFGKATMLSIPRDSFVDIPGHGKSKINEAFTLGGPQLLQQTIEQATGIHIDRYAEIGFGGFANVVDAMGSINLCVPEPLDDPMAGINLAPGCQDLDGPNALGYVRSRYASATGDLARVERQRQFLNAMSDKMTSFSTIANPFRLFPVIKALSKSLTVNESDHVWNLGKLALGMAGQVQQETVPVSGYEDTYAGNVVIWDDAAAKQLFAKLR